MNIIDYMIEERTSSEKLQEVVLGNIGQGWQPFGNLVVDTNDDGTVYLQAMVRYDE